MAMNIHSLVFAVVSVIALTAHAEEDQPVNEARENCRESTSHSKGSPEDERKIIECFESGVYDPCDDASGVHSFITAQCVWVHAKVANRRIQKVEKAIVAKLKEQQNKTGIAQFLDSQRKWRDYVKSYCQFTNIADPEASPLGSVGMCQSRHGEKRADELEDFLGGLE
jgi:uncharacterized protein YecT (DUF1311 family)